MTAQDLYKIQQASGGVISPDGAWIVYSQRRVERTTQKKHANLWVVATRGGAPKQFTFGNHVDHSPAWSPDSKTIAFLSNRDNEKQPQIHTIPIDGGEARPLTDAKGDYGLLQYSPDGKRILCIFRKRDAEVLERDADEQKRKLGVVSRHITRTFYKLDGEGFYPTERWHVWFFDARTGKGTQLTDGLRHDDYDPSWSPDGKKILFVSNRSEEPDLDPEAYDIYVLTVRTARAKPLKLPIGFKSFPMFSPDGKQIVWVGQMGRGEWWRNASLFLIPASGQGKPVDLTGRFDVDASNFTIGDFNDFNYTPPTWSNDGTRIYFQVSRHASTTLHAVRLDTRLPQLETVVDDPGVVDAFSFDRDQRTLTYFHAAALDTGQYIARDMTTGRDRTLTKINRTWFRSKRFGDLEEIWFKGSDGNDLQGWILKPPGFRVGKTYPSILEIHGGPMAQYGNLFMHEFHYLASCGYVVHYCNPRGGMGYGEEHAKAIENDWGGKDYEDLMRWTGHVARKPYIDRKRMGVTGGSYGGYMTCWIVGHTRRFKAAVTQRCVSNLISMYGSSDFNWFFQREFGDRPVWEDVENYWRQSPMKFVGNVKTPTLVIHSEQDLRCDIEQGEQFYVALKKLGVPTEFIRFPDEPHGLSRTGRTDRRIVRLEHIRRWFDRWLT